METREELLWKLHSLLVYKGPAPKCIHLALYLDLPRGHIELFSINAEGNLRLWKSLIAKSGPENSQNK